MRSYCECWGFPVAQMVIIGQHCRRPRFDPRVGKIPWRREWLPTLVFLPGEFHGQRNLEGYSPQGHKELDTTEQLTLSLSFSCHSAYGILVPQPGIEPEPQQWKHWVLTAGPQGNSLQQYFLYWKFSINELFKFLRWEQLRSSQDWGPSNAHKGPSTANRKAGGDGLTGVSCLWVLVSGVGWIVFSLKIHTVWTLRMWSYLKIESLQI